MVVNMEKQRCKMLMLQEILICVVADAKEKEVITYDLWDNT